MRWITCRYAGSTHLGRIQDKTVILLPYNQTPRSMLELIEGGPNCWTHAENIVGDEVPLDEVDLLAPIPRPRKNIMAIGWNYLDHAQETATAAGRKSNIPKDLIVFTKNVTSVNGPYGDVSLDPSVTTQLDWEVELGVVIGIGGRKITETEALRHVFGYTIINDISARDIQSRHKQFFLGKSLDGACPMGPALVSPDELIDPQDLDLKLWVNGVLKQSSNTRFQMFSVASIIATLSRGMRLEPGDIIATGTPAGVGFARTPPEFLKPGDTVECEITGIGRLHNRVVEDRDPADTGLTDGYTEI